MIYKGQNCKKEIEKRKPDVDFLSCYSKTIVIVEKFNFLLDKNDTYYETQTSLTSQGIIIFDINTPFYIDIYYCK